MENPIQKIEYPKLILLLTSILLAYVFFRTGLFEKFTNVFNHGGYISVWIAGFFFSYGFTAPFAVGLLAFLAPNINIFVAALIAGTGAASADLLIFQFIRHSFQDEFDRLKLTWIFVKIHELFDNHLSEKIKEYTLWIIAGFLIASPLPDEFGVSLVSGFTDINKKYFTIAAYILNTIGIFLILLLAK